GNTATRYAGMVTIDTESRIDSVSVSGSPAKAGDTIGVDLIGKRNGTARFSIAGIAGNTLMTENQPGVYRGTYTVPGGINVTNAVLTVTLTDSVGNIGTDTSQLVTIDTNPPEINSVSVSGSPAKAGGTIAVTVIGEPNASAMFSIAGVIDGVPMTQNQPGIYTGTYIVMNGINVTDAVVTVTLTDQVGNVNTDTSQSATIDTTTYEIVSVSVSGSPAKAGGTIQVTAIGEPGVSAKFSISGVVNNVPMTETQSGRYTGAYVVPDGISTTNAVVSVTLTDLVGNMSVDTSQSVAIDTEAPEIDSVNVSGSPAKAGGSIVVIAAGEPGVSAQFSIAGVFSNAPMTETQSGVYTGTYVVIQGVNVTNATVTVMLKDLASNSSVDASQSVTIDTEPPEITSVSVSGSPAKIGGTIGITVVGEPGVPVQFSIAGLVDDVPMTEVQPGVYTGSYAAADDVNVIDAVVTVVLTDSVGNVSVDASQSATIDTQTPEITSVIVSGSPAKAGEPIVATVVGETGLSVQFSIAGVVGNIPMPETAEQAGAYTGMYIVANGINVTDAVVTVTLTDAIGNVSVDTSQQVTMDTTTPEITSVSVSVDPAKTGETIGVTMVGEPGGKALFSIAGVTEDAPMEEDTGYPGTYTGTHTVEDDSINVTDAVLTVTLEDMVGNVGSDASENVSIYPPWDVNSDGHIDTADLVIIGTQFGNAVPAGSDADVNGDGYVDILDLIIVSKNFDESTNAAPAGKRTAAVDPRQLSVLRKLYRSIEGSGDDVMIVRKLLAELIGLPVLQITRSQLMQNYPNPCNPETWIPYELAEADNVTVRIYTPSGQLVRTLDLGHKAAGSYSDRSNAAYWDGMNESGETVSSGIYFYAIESGDFSAVRKMIVSR
ncbi:FlgD immunoglobulin-like domain containing protein, partial [Candidatus Poribacteria bacterium]